MKKNIYGLIDSRSCNFGDICLLDRDEEFLNGVTRLLMNPSIPNYIVEDLVGVRYGTVSYDSDQVYPKFDIAPIPSIIIAGHDLVPARKEAPCDEDLEDT